MRIAISAGSTSHQGVAAPVRVVIPAYDARRTIRRCVEAIASSIDGDEAEIVVADDGGNGDLVDHLAGLPVRVVATGGLKSAGAARNVGTRGFTGRQVVFIDADVIVDPDCLTRLLEPLCNGAAEASVGNYSLDVAGLSYAARYKQLYIIHVYNRRRGYLGGDF
ncbi:MAG: glycosyltransferase family 2 protein [Methylotetracoccus sp.]